MNKWVFAIGGMVMLFLAVGCGRRNNPSAAPQPDDQETIAESVRQTVAALAAQTAVAPANQLAAAPPTIAFVNQVTAVTATVMPPTGASIPSCTVVSGVNLRNGPGVAYDPPVAVAAPGTPLRPLAYVPSGFPLGAWLLVEVGDTSQALWVSAGSQFVSCTADPATLPRPAAIPPTPAMPPMSAPTPSPTSSSLVAMPPVLRNISGGITSCPDHPHIDSESPVVDPRFLLRVDARLFSPPPGESGNGAGIDRVEFVVNEVGFTHTERVAGYCIFQGGEPDCHDWPRDASGRLTWGEGGPPVVDGDYRITATIYPKPETAATQCHWNVLLTIDAP